MISYFFGRCENPVSANVAGHTWSYHDDTDVSMVEVLRCVVYTWLEFSSKRVTR